MIRTEEDGILCPACMMPQKTNSNSAVCEFCGNSLEDNNKVYQLKPGTKLANRYIVGKVIGEGGFGITYIGWDMKLSGRIAIKEYFPVGFVDRRAGDGSDITITAGTRASVFESQKKRFIDEAKILAKFLTERTIVGVSDIITENNTAYTVMNLIVGKNLSEYLKEREKLTFHEAYYMLKPVMVSLGKVHAAGLIHRDLSPSNLMVQEDGSLILLDFGAAREYGEDNEKSLSVILKPGYAPIEQYVSHGDQGPWTDVYSMCATFYKLLTGVTPDNAILRMGTDTLRAPRELGVDISMEQEAALMKGLSITKEGRYSSMNELIHALDDVESGYNGDEADFLNAGKTEQHTNNTTDTSEYEEEEKTSGIFEGVNNVTTKKYAESALSIEEDVNNEEYVKPVDVPKQDKGKRKVGGKATSIIVVLALLTVVIVEIVAFIMKGGSSNFGGDKNVANVVDAVDKDENKEVTNQDRNEEYTVFGVSEQESNDSDGDEPTLVEDTNSVKIVSDSFNVRHDADANSEKKWTAKKGEIYKLVSEKTGTDGKIWYQIMDNEGNKGYIRYDF
ncbi:MAG: protein kinase, partial [Lachnospiraceae bacterium]|nr:protein kinase [Lachnospiraceae bacterium]